MRALITRFPARGALVALTLFSSTFAAAQKNEQPLRELLHQSITLAASRDASLLQKQAEWQASASDIAAAEGERWPQLSLSSNYLPLSSYGSTNRDSAKISASMSLPLFDWGRLASAIESRRYRAVMAGESYLATLDSLALDVSSTTINLARQQATLALAERYVSRMNELVSMLQRIVQTDPGRGSELTQATARLLQAQEARDNAEFEITTLRVMLEKWLGPGASPAAYHTQQWSLIDPDLKKALGNIDNTPPVRELEAKYHAQQASAEEEKAKGLPGLNMVASQSLTGRGNDDFQAGVSVSWNAFSGFTDTAKIQAASLRAYAAKDELAQRKHDATYAVKSQYQNILRLAHQERAWQALAVESERICRMFYQQWYHLGKRTLLDVLIAESEHYNNQVSAVSSRFERYVQIITLRKNAGLLLTWLDNGQDDNPAAVNNRSALKREDMHRRSATETK